MTSCVDVLLEIVNIVIACDFMMSVVDVLLENVNILIEIDPFSCEQTSAI